MKIIKIADLYDYNYSVDVLSALKQYWKTNKTFSCIGSPKTKNMLLYLDGCDAEYINNEGKKTYAKAGNIIYTPIGSQYEIKFFNFVDEKSCTYGMNFMLTDDKSDPFILNNDIIVFDATNENYKMMFLKIVKYFSTMYINRGMIKSQIYNLIASLCEYKKMIKFDKFDIVIKSLKYLEDSSGEDMSIKEISEILNISETYYRRLFKEYFKISPTDYRIANKINKAKMFLEYDNMSITSISENLNFTDSAYFAKMFKKIVGVTPTKYKKSIQK